jgi:hypothetical protein
MSAEKMNVLILCKHLATNFLGVVMHVVESKVRKNACLAYILNASKRCQKIRDRRRIRMIIAIFASLRD